MRIFIFLAVGAETNTKSWFGNENGGEDTSFGK
jgi:hypothetical protein